MTAIRNSVHCISYGQVQVLLTVPSLRKGYETAKGIRASQSGGYAGRSTSPVAAAHNEYSLNRRVQHIQITKHIHLFRALPSYGLSYRPNPASSVPPREYRTGPNRRGEIEHRKGARGEQRTEGAGKHKHLTWKPTRTKSTRMLSRTLVWAPTDSGVFTLTGLSRVEGPPDSRSGALVGIPSELLHTTQARMDKGNGFWFDL